MSNPREHQLLNCIDYALEGLITSFFAIARKQKCHQQQQKP